MAKVFRYGSARVFLNDKTGNTGLREVSLVHEASWGFELPRVESSSIGTQKVHREVISAPSVRFSFKYFISRLENEKALGIPVTTTAIEEGRSVYNWIKDSGPLDFVIATMDDCGEFLESENITNKKLSCYAISNCYITSYSLDINPRQMPSVTIDAVGDYMMFESYPGDGSKLFAQRETILPSMMALANIRDESFLGGTNIKQNISSLSLSIPVQYRSLSDFGKFRYEKKPILPTQCQLSLACTADGFSEGDLDKAVCGEKLNRLTIILQKTNCTNKFKELSAILMDDLIVLNQDYSLGVGGLLSSRYNLTLPIDEDASMVFLQQNRDYADFLTDEDGSNEENAFVQEGSGYLLLEYLSTLMESLHEAIGNK